MSWSPPCEFKAVSMTRASLSKKYGNTSGRFHDPQFDPHLMRWRLSTSVPQHKRSGVNNTFRKVYCTAVMKPNTAVLLKFQIWLVRRHRAYSDMLLYRFYSNPFTGTRMKDDPHNVKLIICRLYLCSHLPKEKSFSDELFGKCLCKESSVSAFCNSQQVFFCHRKVFRTEDFQFRRLSSSSLKWLFFFFCLRKKRGKKWGC